MSINKTSQFLTGDETPEELRTILSEAIARRREIAFARNGVSFAYSQGDGTRSVAYQAANKEDLTQLIAEVRAAQGIRSRRTLRFRY